MFNRKILIFVTVIALLAVSTALGANVERITKEELKVTLDDPNTTVIDVRLGKDWDSSDAKIKGAVREHPSDIGSWADKYAKDALLVFY